MKTKKERTIIACGKQTEKYRNPKEGDVFFECEHCYMCDIHRKRYSCIGCPITEETSRGTFVCGDFTTLRNAQKLLSIKNKGYCVGNSIHHDTLTKRVLNVFEARAKFYNWLAIELEKYPASQFTKKGWKDFEIDKDL